MMRLAYQRQYADIEDYSVIVNSAILPATYMLDPMAFTLYLYPRF